MPRFSTDPASPLQYHANLSSLFPLKPSLSVSAIINLPSASHLHIMHKLTVSSRTIRAATNKTPPMTPPAIGHTVEQVGPTASVGTQMQRDGSSVTAEWKLLIKYMYCSWLFVKISAGLNDCGIMYKVCSLLLHFNHSMYLFFNVNWINFAWSIMCIMRFCMHCQN